MTRKQLELKAIRDKNWDLLVKATALRQEVENKQLEASKAFNESFDAYVLELENPIPEPAMTELEELKGRAWVEDNGYFEVKTEVPGFSIIVHELGYDRTYNFTDAYSIDEAYEQIIEGEATDDTYGDVNQ